MPFQYPAAKNVDDYYFDSLLDVREYVTFDDYQKELEKALDEKPDIVILAAAVSDYGVENYVDGKVRSSSEDMVIRLKPLPKLISTVRPKLPNAVICGFKLLVNSTQEELLYACNKSIQQNELDLIVGNDLRDIKNDNHTLTMCYPSGMEGCFKYDIYEKSKCFRLSDIVADQCVKAYKNKIKNV